MKRLTLIRHAKSSWKDPDLDDFDRPLNKRGQRDAPTMGERLAGRGHLPNVIVSSPAERARLTAQAIAQELNIPPAQLVYDENIYEAEALGLLELIHGFSEQWQHALLVGHNPGLTDLGNLLAACGLDNLPTCGILCIDFDVSAWKAVAPRGGSLVFYDFPKNPRYR